MKKRLLALLLCLVMVIGLVPTVFAVGSELAPSEKEYYVNFDVHGGTPIEKIPAQQGGKLESIPTTTKYGYTFGGWYTNDQYSSPYSFSPLPKPGRDGVNTWAHAKWEAKNYTITFHANNGTSTTTTQS
ncbi:MAG: InlB B-repeat-containing protein, partial [Clostridiales bacterium]|nr:InlB B-repeat-containing protein [Clostridiales bacterium]